MATKTSTLVLFEEKTYLKQPNNVTHMRHDLNPVQLRALIHIIEKSQEKINASISNPQLKLFDNTRQVIQFAVPMSKFGIGPSHYPRLKDSLRKLASIVVDMSVTDEYGKKFQMVGSLMRAIIPEDTYSKDVIIEVDTIVATHLTKVTNGYTKFLKEIIMNNSNNYGQRFYMLISAWRTKPVIAIPYESLKKLLRLEDRYSRFKDFEKRVLKPAKDSLWEKSDLWFDYTPEFNKKKEVESIIFFLYEGIIEEKIQMETIGIRKYVSEAIRRYYPISEAKIADILKFVDTDNYDAILQCLHNAYEYAIKNNVEHVEGYLCKTLLITFAKELDEEIPIIDIGN